MGLQKVKKAGAISAIVLTAAWLQACSSYQTVNADLFDSINEIEASVEALETGMTINEVASSLGVGEEHFYKLNRADIQKARLGADPRINLASTNVDEVAQNLSRIEGYEISYKDIKRSWRFTDFGARIEKNAEGEEMDIVFIFRDGKLEEVIDSGGLVNEHDKDSILPQPGRLLDLKAVL